MAIQTNETPGLLEVIAGYRAGMREFASLPKSLTGQEEDRAYDKLVVPHSEALKNWAGPATSRQGAIEALKFMIEDGMFNDMAGEPLARAVIAFLEGH
ncbi:hypothetical protein CO665_28245 [Rhizobium anhuiense]|uniref:hypothetical protein n=1 Tax=Rhizobium anhuiense TaxID=1184720 RepID=UPI000BEA8D0F|nr:hypothetical protein [Rhizobium anhuiense]PDS34847.1 hypothetical protein CO665_28245 [Rhizobium anhuiense]